MSRSRLLATPLKTALAASLLLASSAGFAQSATEAELARKLDQLAAELANVKAQLVQLQQQRAAPAPGAAPAPAATPVVATTPPRPTEPATVLSSYGEINYNRPTRASQNAQADVRRFGRGAPHRFDAKTKVVTELEVEHAVSSADDSGEVEVEQAYIEHQLTRTWAVRGGLFLMPVGLLN
ncbi:MAG TPA: hypothetical protein VGJ65_14085, partial [Albitalea sp.]